MGLNKQKGNMYEFVTHTWNSIKGRCPHECSYCYMKKWGEQPELHFDEKEMRADLGSGNFIFVGSSCDMFAEDIPEEWILKTLSHMQKFDNKYLLQTKNTYKLSKYKQYLPKNTVICVTIESDIYMSYIMGKSPTPRERIDSLMWLTYAEEFPVMITIEPIIEFHEDKLIGLVKRFSPFQVNIGADSGNNNLPEPSAEQVSTLIAELEKFTKVVQKKNLRRLLL